MPDIHADENLARLFHGLPPFSVFAPPCQTCGSARSSRNPRYRGGGPPALERKPFCLERLREWHRHHLFPWIMLPAFPAELGLALWLTLKGVNIPKWKERAQG